MIERKKRLWRRMLVLLFCWGALCSFPPAGLAQEAEQEPPASPSEETEQGEAKSDDREALLQRMEADAELLDLQSRVIRNCVRIARESVVHLETKTLRPLRMQGRSNRFHQIRESGSGIIVEIEGETYILTNGHVLADASLEGIKIVLEDGRELRPKRVRSNNDYDIAAIEIEENELVPARIGDSDRVQIGDFVVTIGSPFGLSRSVTSGIISAKGRNRIPLGEKAGSVQDFLQTDAAINPGNSGGPLIDSRGRVIGMVTAIATSSGGSEGVGFAIPINLVMRIARQLVGSGRVLRPYLGVELDPNYNMEKAQEAGLKTRKGTRISTVHSNSPAAKAGLARGDIILTVDQREITDDDHLVNVIGLKEVGETIHLVGVRGEIPFETDVELESQPSE